MSFFPGLLIVFAVIAFVGTWLFGSFGGFAVAFGAGYFMGLMGTSGGQTLGIFATPLAGVIVGIGVAMSLPFMSLLGPPAFSGFWWIMLFGGFGAYILGHIGGLLTLRKLRVPGL